MEWGAWGQGSDTVEILYTVWRNQSTNQARNQARNRVGNVCSYPYTREIRSVNSVHIRILTVNSEISRGMIRNHSLISKSSELCVGPLGMRPISTWTSCCFLLSSSYCFLYCFPFHHFTKESCLFIPFSYAQMNAEFAMELTGSSQWFRGAEGGGLWPWNCWQ